MKKIILALAILFSVVSCETCTTGPGPDTEIHVVHNKKGKPLVWDQRVYPLHLDLDSRLPPSAIRDITQAVDEWESIAERELFVMAVIADEIAILNPQGGHVSFSFANLTETPEGKHLGETRYFTVLGSMTRVHSITVEVDESILENPLRMYTTALHELGHVLLLSHDWDVQSIMYKDVTESFLVIQPKHVRHIQDRYGHLLMP